VKIKILPSALADLDRGRIFYARQSKGIGDYFLDSLFSDIDSLELYAGVHIKVFDFHRLLSKRFPYAVYYKVDEDVCVARNDSPAFKTSRRISLRRRGRGRFKLSYQIGLMRSSQRAAISSQSG
jgi:hypothetical protein